MAASTCRSLSSASWMVSSKAARNVSAFWPLALTHRIRGPEGIVRSDGCFTSSLTLAKRLDCVFSMSRRSRTFLLRIDSIVESSLKILPVGRGTGSGSSLLGPRRLEPALQPSILFALWLFLVIIQSFLKVKPVSSTSANRWSCKTALFSPTHFVWLTHTSSGSFTIRHRMPLFIPKGILNFTFRKK